VFDCGPFRTFPLFSCASFTFFNAVFPSDSGLLSESESSSLALLKLLALSAIDLSFVVLRRFVSRFWSLAGFFPPLVLCSFSFPLVPSGCSLPDSSSGIGLLRLPASGFLMQVFHHQYLKQSRCIKYNGLQLLHWQNYLTPLLQVLEQFLYAPRQRQLFSLKKR
jgi:hypothetical protein